MNSLDIIESKKLLSVSDLSQPDIAVLDTSQMRLNYRALYGTMMINGYESWIA